MGIVCCDDPVCSLKKGTRQLSVAGNVCLARGCSGRIGLKYSERSLHTQLKYLDTLFDVQHASEQVSMKNKNTNKLEVAKYLSKHDKVAMEELHDRANRYLRGSAFNWIEPTLWTSLFGIGIGSKKQ